MSTIPDCASVSTSFKDTAKAKLLLMANRHKTYERYIKDSGDLMKRIDDVKIAISNHPSVLPSYKWARLNSTERLMYTTETKRLASELAVLTSQLGSIKMDLIEADFPKYGVTMTTSSEIISIYKKDYVMFHEYIAICGKFKTMMIWSTHFDEIHRWSDHDVDDQMKGCPIIYHREFIDLLCACGFHVKYKKETHTKTITVHSSCDDFEKLETVLIHHELTVSCCGGLDVEETNVSDDE